MCSTTIFENRIALDIMSQDTYVQKQTNKLHPRLIVSDKNSGNMSRGLLPEWFYSLCSYTNALIMLFITTLSS